MRMKKILLLLFILMFAVTLRPVLAAADSNISDTAELMTTSVRENLNTRLAEMENIYQKDFFIITLSDLNGETTIEDYARKYYTGGSHISEGVTLYICMGTRDVYIYTLGTSSYAVNAYGTDYIYDKIIPYLTDGKYDTALGNYVDLLDNFMHEFEHSIAFSENNPYRESPLTPTNILIVMGVSALISLSAVFVMKSQLKSVRPQTAALNYVKDFNLTKQSDIFLYSRTTRTAKPKANSSGRSGGGGGSGGGGARKF